MSTVEENAIRRPWYREPMVWLVILFPMLAVCGGITTLFLAVRSDDGLVVDDYYKRGLEINKTLERDHQAETYALKAKLDVNPETHAFSMNLAADRSFTYPAQITVTFVHATRSGLDRRMLALRQDGTLYTGALPQLAKGDWYVHLEADNWRLIDKLRIR
jgi:hypothetical protein